ncbi:MAG: hypothetical protein RIC55_14560 [Pirellulaceae bacterium]
MFHLTSKSVIVALLVAASGAAAVCALAAAGASESPGTAVHLMFSVGLAQIALLSAYLAWGGRWLLLRVLLLAGGLACWARPMDAWQPRGDAHWLFVLTLYSGMIVVVLCLLRATGRGGVCDRPTAAKDARRSAVRVRTRRYSLLGLMSLMTAVSILLGLLRLSAIPIDSLGEAMVFSATFAALSVFAVLAGSWLRSPGEVILAMLGATIVCTGWLHWLGGTRDYLLVCGALGGHVALAMQALHSGGVVFRTPSRGARPDACDRIPDGAYDTDRPR